MSAELELAQPRARGHVLGEAGPPIGCHSGERDRLAVSTECSTRRIGCRPRLTPQHPYTQALFASAPSMDPDRRMERPPLAGDPPNPINPPSGCRFRTRCAFATPRCAEAAPPPVAVAPDHDVACYLYEAAAPVTA